MANGKADAASIRQQIEELQVKLLEAEQQERESALLTMKEHQKRYRFTARELGHLFKPRRRGER